MTTARPVINDPYDAFRQDSDAWLPGVPGGPLVEFARDIDTFAWVAEALFLPKEGERKRLAVRGDILYIGEWEE